MIFKARTFDFAVVHTGIVFLILRSNYMPVFTTITSINRLLNQLQSPLLLTFRLYVSYVFFSSGLQKLNTWNDEYGVKYLFQEEYKVPLLNPEIAAFMATAGELILPVLLVLGLGTRYFAIALSVLNIVAVISYYDALAKVGQVTPHIFWGACLMTLIVFGAGYFSMDRWIASRHK